MSAPSAKGAQDARKFLVETLEECAGVLLSHFGKVQEVRRKGDRSLVTSADLASEKVVLDRIRRFFPDDVVLSEESGYSADPVPGSSYVWVVDPLDGTTNFANQYPFFATSIGRCEYGRDGKLYPVLGGVADPIRQSYYVGVRGGGATKNGAPIRVSDRRALEDGFLCTGFYYNTGDLLAGEMARFAKAGAVCQAIRRDGAAALDLALVAGGIYDCFWELGLSLWDLAAGVLLVQEAGGEVRNYGVDPGPYVLEGSGVLAGSSAMVRELSRVLF